METSNENKNVIKALSQAQKEFQTVTKDRENPFASSRYATLDAILKEVLPKLNNQGLFLTQEPLTEQEENSVKIGVQTTIFHESGEWVRYEPLFMILEKGAKMNMAQSAGSVITYAKRYSVSAIFGISTDEDNDGVQPTYQPVNNKKEKYDNKNNQRPQKEEKPEQPKEPSLNEAIVGYVDQIKKMGGDIQSIYSDISSVEGKNTIKEVDKVRILGHLKSYALSMQRAQSQTEDVKQESLMKNGTTTAQVDWGNA